MLFKWQHIIHFFYFVNTCFEKDVFFIVAKEVKMKKHKRKTQRYLVPCQITTGWNWIIHTTVSKIVVYLLYTSCLIVYCVWYSTYDRMDLCLTSLHSIIELVVISGNRGKLWKNYGALLTSYYLFWVWHKLSEQLNLFTPEIGTSCLKER